MAGRIKWTDRRFDFTFPAGLYPEMIERLRGTPARLEDRMGSMPAEVLQRRDVERWSIQENAGHLLDLESLLMERLDQYMWQALSSFMPQTCQTAKLMRRNTTVFQEHQS